MSIANPPPAPVDNSTALSFGNQQLKNFLIDPDYLNMNHGSFGTVSRQVLVAQQNYILQQEARPDPWFRKTYKDLLAKTRDLVAKECGLSDSSGLVMLENASAAVNAIFRSMSLNDGDIFVYFSTAYGMVKHTASWLEAGGQGAKEIRILEVPITVPIKSKDCFLGPLEAALENLSQEVRPFKKSSFLLSPMSNISPMLRSQPPRRIASRSRWPPFPTSLPSLPSLSPSPT